MLRFVFPADCFGCGEPLPGRALEGACLTCWSRLRRIGRNACDGCGLPTTDSSDLDGGPRRCAACWLDPPLLDGVRAVVLYDDLARRFVLRAKVGCRPELLRFLGGEMARPLAPVLRAWSVDVVAAVPSHPWSDLRRGFSPGALLARALAGPAGLPVARRLLGRRLSSPTEIKGRDRARRRRGLRGAVYARGEAPGARVLLVDDVLTTGATAEACAGALRAAGADAVYLAVWARVEREKRSDRGFFGPREPPRSDRRPIAAGPPGRGDPEGP